MIDNNSRTMVTNILRKNLKDAIELYDSEKKLGYEADVYKARGKVEAIADVWSELDTAGLAHQRDIHVYGSPVRRF